MFKITSYHWLEGLRKNCSILEKQDALVRSQKLSKQENKENAYRAADRRSAVNFQPDEIHIQLARRLEPCK